MTKRIAIVNSDFWVNVMTEYRASHPSRTWPDAAIIAHLAELGYLAWKGVSNPVVNPVHTPHPVPQAVPQPVQIYQPEPSPIPPVTNEPPMSPDKQWDLIVAHANAIDDDFPFPDLIKR